MDANELRIGNWVRYKDSKEKVKVLQIRRDGSHQLSGYNLCTTYYSEVIGEYEPIPLTEEILLKCGFELTEECKMTDKVKIFELGDYGVKTWYDDTCVFFKDVTPIKTNLKHLHQLQNLYFAITGEELKIEL